MTEETNARDERRYALAVLATVLGTPLVLFASAFFTEAVTKFVYGERPFKAVGFEISSSAGAGMSGAFIATVLFFVASCLPHRWTVPRSFVSDYAAVSTPMIRASFLFVVSLLVAALVGVLVYVPDRH